MPCSDVTELLRLTLDAEDRLADYAFVKRTCGQGVGAANLLLPLLECRGLDDLLGISPEAFLETYTAEESIEEFLALKHLIAIQSALRVLIGQAPCGSGELCAASEIEHAPDATTIQVRISVELLTKEIESCGNCGSCGSAKSKPARA